MPTTDELYDRLIKPNLAEKAAKAYAREVRRKEKAANPELVILKMDEGCAER